jgi:phosphoribosyl 1,2-cyclic phosphate phosphodiesterase
MQATLTFLGTGTSMGVPTLGCHCAVCQDARLPGSRNRRTRPSVLLAFNHKHVLIDTGPDFYHQALHHNLTTLDAVFYTHHHADHILGMDDLRPLTFRHPERPDLPLYADAPTAEVLHRVFNYTFRTVDRYPTSARVRLVPLPEGHGARVPLFGAEFTRIPVIHGRDTITGYRFGSAAYLTDLSDLHPDSIPHLQGLDLLILDALRRDPHPSHSHLAKSIEMVERLAPRRAFFTHMSHDLDHTATEAILPPHIRLAYDGLALTFNIAPA